MGSIAETWFWLVHLPFLGWLVFAVLLLVLGFFGLVIREWIRNS